MLCIIHGCSNNVLEPFLTILGSVSYHTAWGKQRRLSFLVFPVKTSKNNWFKIPHLLFLEPPTAWSIFLSINKSLPKTAEIQSPNLESRGRSLSFSSVFVTTRTNQWFDWPLQRHTHTHTQRISMLLRAHGGSARTHTLCSTPKLHTFISMQHSPSPLKKWVGNWWRYQFRSRWWRMPLLKAPVRPEHGNSVIIPLPVGRRKLFSVRDTMSWQIFKENSY